MSKNISPAGTQMYTSSDFAKEIKAKSGTDFNTCYHCQSCGGGCPFSEAMDYLPNQIIRLVQLGCKKEVLESSAIWICVGCNNCSIQCPNGVDISAVTHTLCQLAIEEKVTIAEPGIYKFHQEVLNTVHRYGRTHKLEIMLRYKFYKKDWFSDMGIGMKMLAKRKLELFPSRVTHMKDVHFAFNHKQAG